jgi:hypothetical protein
LGNKEGDSFGKRKVKRMAGGIKATFFQNHTKRIRAAQAQREVFCRLCASGEAVWEKGQRLHNDSWESPGQAVGLFQSRLISELLF